MNFLAHLYLSGQSHSIKVGNFIGDFVKGKAYLNYPPDVQKGILLHRSIDMFTDSSKLAAILNSRKRLSIRYRLYSYVIVDIFYDHFLAIHWNRYSVLTFDDYITNCYTILKQNRIFLPQKVQNFLPRMIAANRLKSYGEIDGIANALRLMSKYTSLPDETDFAIKTLKTNYQHFSNEFNDFFPTVIDHVKYTHNIHDVGK